MTDSASLPSAGAVLEFWFGPIGEGEEQSATRQTKRQKWFQPDPEFDQACAAFAGLIDAARNHGLSDWLTQPESTLAYVIVCDQLPRNIYRGTAQAFAADDLALAAARQAVREQYDVGMGLDERAFLYMPFEHSEQLLDQHIAVGLFSQLHDQTQGELRNISGNNLKFAHQHRDIIQRFGRFPHRNSVLGRQSTPSEEEFLEGSDGFGQTLT